jgi:hypothetical protein
VKTVAASTDAAVPVLGGLNIEDAFATMPKSKVAAKVQVSEVPEFNPSTMARDMSQKNNVRTKITLSLYRLTKTPTTMLQVVTMVESDSESVQVKPVKPQKKSTSNGAKVRDSCSFISVSSTTPPPAQTPHDVAVATASGGKVNIPDFAKALWRKSFLPSIYSAFYAADQPFENFRKNSVQLLETLQTVVCDVYPDFYYKVQFGDAFMIMV